MHETQRDQLFLELLLYSNRCLGLIALSKLSYEVERFVAWLISLVERNGV